MFVIFLIFSCVTLANQATALPSCVLKKLRARIHNHGYPTEVHYVETSDSYILNLFRIPYSPKLNNNKHYRPPVLLQHGILSNSDCWISSGPDNALAYLLADAGYDVWLGNARGNIYSRNNSKISTKNPKFWHFDWHEIGIYDIAAMIDYILEVTNEKQLHYIGHSQGTTVFLVLMSERPEYNSKIKSAQLLAPCAFFKHGTSFVYDMLRPLIGKPGGIWNKIFSNVEVLPQNELVIRLADTACGIEPSFGPLCRNMYLMFIGDGYKNTNITALQQLIETHPAGASSNQIIHFIQLSVSHKFQQIDWGSQQNQILYGQTSPPEYNLDKITAPIYLYTGSNDALCSPKDVDILSAKLKALKIDYRIPDVNFNHLDFIIGKNIKEMLNEPVIQNMAKHEIFQNILQEY